MPRIRKGIGGEWGGTEERSMKNDVTFKSWEREKREIKLN